MGRDAYRTHSVVGPEMKLCIEIVNRLLSSFNNEHCVSLRLCISHLMAHLGMKQHIKFSSFYLAARHHGRNANEPLEVPTIVGDGSFPSQYLLSLRGK